MARAACACYRTLLLLLQLTKEGGLWPALITWLSQQEGLEAMWGALGWSIRHAVKCDAAWLPFDLLCMLNIAVRLVKSLVEKNLLEFLKRPSLVSTLQTLLSALPTAMASMRCSPDLKVLTESMLSAILSFCKLPKCQLAGKLHRSILSAWPVMMAAFRRPGLRVEEKADMRVRVHCGQCWLCICLEIAIDPGMLVAAVELKAPCR